MPRTEVELMARLARLAEQYRRAMAELTTVREQSRSRRGGEQVMASGFWNVNESAANVGRAQDRQARTEAARKQAAAAKAAQRGGKRI